ncbi:hypothetical protein CHS0354_004154 [Potamilus streckersoni]|uniref:b(0,+)-type amino acid transporter 1 n=1 Tax=Potamilus streckersoni TaxID=2493646 RepID=A0AAE0W3Q2_9BIVA|nr:hypothetical protein CHS0354_004154 [Potamilus streckersoni]
MTENVPKDSPNSTRKKKENGGPEVAIVQEKIQMEKSVGLIGGISIIVGTVIGSGIFISPKGVLEKTGSVGLSLIVWTVSGILALMGALCYAELGTLIRKSGGEYIYLKTAFGDIPAFLYAWTSVIVIRTSSIAIICLTFAEYMGTFFPFCGPAVIPTKLVAAAIIVTLMVINCASTSLAAKTQIFFTGAKLLALAIIVVGGIVRLCQGHVTEFSDSFNGSSSSASSIALACYDALWAYDGWNNLNYITEELQDPKKNLPRANIFGVLLVTVIYVMANISYLTAMTSAELLTSDAVAVTWGERVLGVAAIILPLAVLCSTFGAANGSMFTGGRVVYAAGREGHLPELLSFIQCKSRTPLPSLVFTTIISLLMIIPGDVGSLVDFFSFTAWIFYGSTVAALLFLRWKMRDAERIFTVPIFIPILFVLIAIYLVIGPIVDSPKIEFLYALIFVVGGLVFYFPFVYFKLLPNCLDGVTTFFQLFWEIVPSAYEPDS